MNRQEKPQSSRNDDFDAAVLLLDDYTKTLEALILRLEISHQAGKFSAKPNKSKSSLLEGHAALVNSNWCDTFMLQRLQLAYERTEKLVLGDRELQDMCAENYMLSNKVLKIKEELEEARETILKLQEEHHRSVEKGDTLEEEDDDRSKFSPEEHKFWLQEEQQKLKVLNNIFLQLIISSDVDWSQDYHLRMLVEKISKFL